MRNWKNEYYFEVEPKENEGIAFAVTIMSVSQETFELEEGGIAQMVVPGQVIVQKQTLREKGYGESLEDYIRYWINEGGFYEEGEKIFRIEEIKLK